MNNLPEGISLSLALGSPLPLRMRLQRPRGSALPPPIPIQTERRPHSLAHLSVEELVVFKSILRQHSPTSSPPLYDDVLKPPEVLKSLPSHPDLCGLSRKTFARMEAIETNEKRLLREYLSNVPSERKHEISRQLIEGCTEYLQAYNQYLSIVYIRYVRYDSFELGAAL